VKLLLDTHVLLWSVSDPDRIASAARAQIEDASNVRLLSAASAWEIATKHALGKLPLRESPQEFLLHASADLVAEELTITARHAVLAASLPNHHRDPFDRLLVAQAMVEGATLVTADHLLPAYGVPLLWASAR
jgi:PIN domain nuclease of toxin-antitoxin system